MPVEPIHTLIWYQGRSGAGQRFSFRLGEIMRQSDTVRQTSFLLNEADDYIDQLQELGQRVVSHEAPSGRERPWKLVFDIPRRFWKFKHAVDDLKPDIVICSMNFALAWPFLEYVRWRKIPIVYVCHDPEPHVGDYGVLWQRWVQPIMIKRASAVVALSDFGFSSLSRSYPGIAETKLASILLQNQTTQQRIRPRNPRTEGPVRFLCLGRLIAYKGFDILAESIKLLGERTDWTLTIAGNGKLKDDILRTFGDDARIDLTRLTWLEEHEIDVLVDDHDILLLPYRGATQSGTLIEAMLKGVPCLVTPVGELAKQIGNGDAGWVANAVSAQAVASAMSQAIDDARSDNYTARSRAALQQCDNTVALKQWSALLRKVADTSEVYSGKSVNSPG